MNYRVCDVGNCRKKAIWKAALDALEFCGTHKYEWIRDRAGYNLDGSVQKEWLHRTHQTITLAELMAEPTATTTETGVEDANPQTPPPNLDNGA